MFCPHCGTKVQDGAAFCSACGTRLNTPTAADPVPVQPVIQPQYVPPQPVTYIQPQVQVQPQAEEKQKNTVAIVGFVLSFFYPLAGLICSIVGLVKSKKCGQYKGFSIAGIVISAVSLVVSFISSIVFMAMFISSEPFAEFLGAMLILPILMLFLAAGGKFI